MLAAIKNFFYTPKSTVVIPRPITLDWHLDQVVKNRYTPDASLLEVYKTHPVFICDDFMTRHRRNEHLEGSTRYRFAFTKAAFSMFTWKKGQQAFPLPFLERSSMTPHSVIKGEVHFLPLSAIKYIDEHRGNGLKFNRIRVRVVVPYHINYYRRISDASSELVHSSREMKQTMICFMWIANKAFWDDQPNWAEEFSPTTQNTFAGGEPHLATENAKYYFFKYGEYFRK